MRIFKFIIVLFIGLSIVSAKDVSDYFDSATMSIGQSKDGIAILRFGLRKNFNVQWLKSDIGYFGGYWELSGNYWSKGDSSIYGVALSPVFIYRVTSLGEIEPYIEGSIGASLWTDTMIAGRNVSSNYLFEDRIGYGIKYKRFDLSFRYMHYSNAGIVRPNSGIDIFITSVTYKF